LKVSFRQACMNRPPASCSLPGLHRSLRCILGRGADGQETARPFRRLPRSSSVTGEGGRTDGGERDQQAWLRTAPTTQPACFASSLITRPWR
jgi:hypothetical protein